MNILKRIPTPGLYSRHLCLFKMKCQIFILLSSLLLNQSCANFLTNQGLIPYLKPLENEDLVEECLHLWFDPVEKNECDLHIGLYIEKLQNPTGLIGSWAFKSKPCKINLDFSGPVISILKTF